MKKLLLFACLCLYSNMALTQTISEKEKLYYTCKVWGFVKYYHSEVSTCQVNWDSVLTHYIPSVKAANTTSDFNKVLDSMIADAGPMAIATTPPPSTLPPELRRNIDFSWINDPTLSQKVKNELDTIKNNFRPHPNCWVQSGNGSSSGFLLFPYDSLMLNVNTISSYPDEQDRLLMFFKYWNIVRYFNPYNYALDTPWDSTLYYMAVDVANASSSTDLYNVIDKITARLDDAHAEGLTYNTNTFYNTAYQPRVLLKYVDNKYVVVKSAVSGIAVGDDLVSIDGKTTQQWEDSLRPYISAGNASVFHRYMCLYIIAGDYGSTINMVLKNSIGNTYSITNHRDTYLYNNWILDYYPSDSLKNKKWETMPCNVGYVHMGNLEQTDVSAMYADLKNKPVIIFDIRNYPQGTAFTLTNYMYAQPTTFAHDLDPDLNYPGTYSWYHHTLGVNNNDPYTGTAILLMNQETQSHAEYSCMILEALPNVIKVGSQTAGADGNISSFQLSKDIYTGFTTLGVFYPNGDSTQRIGIVPDTVVYPTQAGIRAGRDEVLEKAMQIACAITSVPGTHEQEMSAKIYPNPARDILIIESPEGQAITLTISDVTGKVLMNTNIHTQKDELDVSALPQGMYLLQLNSGATRRTFKFTKL